MQAFSHAASPARPTEKEIKIRQESMKMRERSHLGSLPLFEMKYGRKNDNDCGEIASDCT